MSEHGPVLPLGQKCVRPGEWLIEGWRVTRENRLPGHGSGRLHQVWTARRDGDQFEQDRLDDIRDEIRNRA